MWEATEAATEIAAKPPDTKLGDLCMCVSNCYDEHVSSNKNHVNANFVYSLFLAH